MQLHPIQTKTDTTPSPARDTLSRRKPTRTAAPAPWRPQPINLTRAELRLIVEDVVG